MSMPVSAAFKTFFKEKFSKPPVVRTKRKSVSRQVSPTNMLDLNLSREEEDNDALNLLSQESNSNLKVPESHRTPKMTPESRQSWFRLHQSPEIARKRKCNSMENIFTPSPKRPLRVRERG